MRIELVRKSIDNSRHMDQQEMLKEYEIIRKAARNPEHFQVLYDMYFERIFNFIYRRTDDEDTTADLTSQTFLLALGHLKKYKFKGVPFSAWLYRIATNEVSKYYRKSRQRMVFSLEEDAVENLLEQHLDEEQKDMDVEEVVKQMHKMQPGEIEVLELRFFEEKPFAEIAYILDINEATAKMRTYRAIDKLKQLFRGTRS